MNSVCSTAGRPLFAPGGPMRVHKLAWLGTRTDNPEATVAFFRSLLGLSSDHNRHFTTGPVAGFLVDDVEAASAELAAAGVEVVQPPVHDAHGNAWAHV